MNKPFIENRREVLQGLMETYSFAIVLTQTASQHAISLLPLVLDVRCGVNGTLLGHMAKANPHWELMTEENQTTIIFHGPHSYISPSWYADARQVPTWNYAVAFAEGKGVAVHDQKWLESLLRQLTEIHEIRGPKSWQFNPEADYVKNQIGG